MPYGNYSRYRSRTRRTRSKTARSTYRSRPKRYARYRSTRRSVKVSPQRPFWQNPLPQKAYYKLRYQDSAFDLTPNATTGQAVYVWRGDSLYDPDYTGTGAQPYSYDQLCSIGSVFNSYRVYGSKIKITPFSNSSGILSVRMALVPSRSASFTYTEFEDILQIPGARSITLKDASNLEKHLVSYCSVNKLYGKGAVNGSDHAAQYNTSPTSGFFWVLYVDVNERTGTTPAIKVDCRITFYACLYHGDDVNES